MVLLAINTTIVTTGIVVFLIVILILVGILLFAKAKLTAKGDVKMATGSLQPNRAAHCCPPWQARKYSCLRPVVVKVPVVCVNAR